MNDLLEENGNIKDCKFPSPDKAARSNLSKEEALKCKHSWAYGGGVMWCRNCGWFKQPESDLHPKGAITKSPGGRGKEILESIYSIDKNCIDSMIEGGITIIDDLETVYEFFSKKEMDHCAHCNKKLPMAKMGKVVHNKKKFYLCYSSGSGATDCASYPYHLMYLLDEKRGGTEEERAKTVDKAQKRFIDEIKNEELRSLVKEWAEFMAENLKKYKTLSAMKSKGVWNSETELHDGLIKESIECHVDLSETQAKKTLGTLSAGIINDGKKVTQYTANIYSNIITKNLLELWTKDFKKLTITLGDTKEDIVEFIVPKMSQDFVARFVAGHESIPKFLRRSNEIKLRISPKVFQSMKNRDDAFYFFKAAVKYYDSQVNGYATRIMSEVMKFGHNMKHLISHSKLSGLVTYPLSLLFAFDGVDLSNRNTFKIETEDIDSVNRFIKGIATSYASPEKEKKQIIEDVKDLVKELRESVESIGEITYLSEAVQNYLSGNFDEMILEASRLFIEGQIDHEYKPGVELKQIYESWGVKKLKKIPKDLVAYIQIETESIKDSNDKMMISSYCLGKLEIVEWYIELLEVGSKKYVVPHNRPYLEMIRTQLLACFKQIMDVKITNPADRPIIDIKYPKGYEG